MRVVLQRIWGIFGLIAFFSGGLCLDSWGSFAPVLALYDPFGVDVPLNIDITHTLIAFKVILRSFGALSIFRNLGLMIRDGRNILSGYNS